MADDDEFGTFSPQSFLRRLLGLRTVGVQVGEHGSDGPQELGPVPLGPPLLAPAGGRENGAGPGGGGQCDRIRRVHDDQQEGTPAAVDGQPVDGQLDVTGKGASKWWGRRRKARGRGQSWPISY